MDNQELDKAKSIDRYLKGDMNLDEKRSFEDSLKQDESLRQSLENTEIVSKAIQYKGLKEDVNTIRTQMLSEEKVTADRTEQSKTVERSMPFGVYAFRIAASLLILLVAFAGIQMATVNPQSIYQEKIFLEVVDVVERSDEESTSLSSILEAYQQNNFEDAAALYSRLENPSVKEMYIAAAALLNLQQYTEATQVYLQIVESAESLSSLDYWQQRAAYNLSITYVQTGDYDKAIPLLESLKSHEAYGDYYDQLFSDYSLWKLRLLRFKNSLFSDDKQDD